MNGAPGPVVVGVMRSDAVDDALALGARLAATGGTDLLLVCAYPYEPAPDGRERPEYEALVRTEAEDLLAGCAARVEGVAARTLAVASFAPARVLHDVAAREGARAIVIASTHRGAPGRAATGTVADRLLTGAPCPVAIAPRGYAQRPWSGSFARVGAALAPAGADPRVLDAVRDLATGGAAAVELLTVAEPGIWRRDAWAGRATADELGAAQREILERRAAEAATALDGLPVRTVLLEGDPAEELGEASESLDVLVCGSRAYGPASIVLVGGVSKALARGARCPLVVVTRKA
jgi:nucleotide-binding universal stress UspA family protein